VSSRIALGTVQFGISYGVSNNSGMVSSEMVSKILDIALLNKINTLDTASAYGESERVLGMLNISKWNVISKIAIPAECCTNISEWVRLQVKESLIRLREPYIHGILVHNSKQLLGEDGEEIWNSLQNLKTEGLVKKVGVSIYSPDELELLFKSFNLDIVQCPYNIIDRRLKTSGWLQRMNNMGVEVHIRSIFLQGLLLMSRKDRPDMFNTWSILWDNLEKWIAKNDMTPLQASLAFALDDTRISKVIIGVETVDQLKEILSFEKFSRLKFPENLSTTDLKLIDPSQWNIENN
jgi:aryl-alcohol dehydrogenase-like predicted oxidoreductase